MNNLWAEIASYGVRAAWQVPLVAGAGWLGCRLVRPLGAATEHRLWVATLLAAVTLPALPGSQVWQSLWFSGAHGTAHASLHVGSVVRTASRAVNRWALPIGVLRVLTLMYVAAMLFFALRLLRSVRRTSALRRRAFAAALTGPVEQMWQCCQQNFGIAGAELLLSTEISGPVTISLGRPAVLLPAQLLACPEDGELMTALAHECAHLRRYDFRKNLLYELLALPIAFHPVTWLIKAGIEASREMLCDALVVRSLVAPQVYVRALLRLATAMPSLPGVPTNAIGILDANILERRVMTIRSEKEPVSSGKRWGLTVAGVLCLVAAIGGGTTAAVALVPTAAEGNTQAPKLYVVGKDATAPVLISQTDPEFPPSAKEDKKPFNGTCSVSLIVNEAGIPQDLKVKTSLSPDFDREALKAVAQYRFHPALHEGRPVPVELSVDINFQRF